MPRGGTAAPAPNVPHRQSRPRSVELPHAGDRQNQAVAPPVALLWPNLDSDRQRVGETAALLQSVVKNHALVDGNKRLGWLATGVFLHLNGIAAETAANDDVYDLVMDVAAGRHTVDEIASALKAIVQDR